MSHIISSWKLTNTPIVKFIESDNGFGRVWIVIFFANIESTIVSTSLVTITNEYKSFSQADWIVSAYQITYTCEFTEIVLGPLKHRIPPNGADTLVCLGFLIIWAKIGDIFGRKPTLLSAMLLFAVFSGGCGAAQTMTQL
jgi:MFS family permease